MTELKSLRKPTKILTALMFVAFIVYNLGTEGLHQILPDAPSTLITVIFFTASWIVMQYGLVDRRVVRAEDIKVAELTKNNSENEASEGNFNFDEDIDPIDDEIDENGE